MPPNPRVSPTISRLRSARWLIAGGYASGVAGFAIGNWLPRGNDELGIANAMTALALGGLVGTILLLVGLARGMQAVVRDRAQVRWFDYTMLAAGLAPLVFMLIAQLLPG